MHSWASAFQHLAPQSGNRAFRYRTESSCSGTGLGPLFRQDWSWNRHSFHSGTGLINAGFLYLCLGTDVVAGNCPSFAVVVAVYALLALHLLLVSLRFQYPYCLAICTTYGKTRITMFGYFTTGSSWDRKCCNCNQWGRRLEGWPNGGPTGWLAESDRAGVILYVMELPYCLPFLYCISCPDRSCPDAVIK
jgi:hypothetical protein